MGAQLGDVDLTETLTARLGTNDEGVRQAYAQRSGRRFTSFIDEMLRPEKDALQLLRHRSPYLNMQEDVSRFTDGHQ